MPIYTKKGDKGTTKTLRQKDERISKDSAIVETLGAVDQLNSYLGVVKSQSQSPALKDKITKIQVLLLTIGSITAGATLSFSKKHTSDLEKQIDEMDKVLPALTHFVIPGGSILSAHLQYARTLARALERRMVALSSEIKVKPTILTFLNRLSDYIFTLARYENFRLNIADDQWVTKKSKK